MPQHVQPVDESESRVSRPVVKHERNFQQEEENYPIDKASDKNLYFFHDRKGIEKKRWDKTEYLHLSPSAVFFVPRCLYIDFADN